MRCLAVRADANRVEPRLAALAREPAQRGPLDVLLAVRFLVGPQSRAGKHDVAEEARQHAVERVGRAQAEQRDAARPQHPPSSTRQATLPSRVRWPMPLHANTTASSSFSSYGSFTASPTRKRRVDARRLGGGASLLDHRRGDVEPFDLDTRVRPARARPGRSRSRDRARGRPRAGTARQGRSRRCPDRRRRDSSRRFSARS